MKRKLPNNAMYVDVEINLYGALEDLEACEKWDVLQAMWDDLRNMGDNDEDWEDFCDDNKVSFSGDEYDEDEEDEDEEDDNEAGEYNNEGSETIYWQVGDGDLHSIPPEAKVYIYCDETGCYKRVV